MRGPGRQQAEHASAACHCSNKSDWIQGCIHRGTISRDRDMIIPLYSVILRPHLKCCLLFFPQFKKDKNRLKGVQMKATKMIKGLENLASDERRRNLCIFSMEKKRFKGDFITVFQYSKGGYIDDGVSFFTKSHTERASNNAYKLHWEMFHLDILWEFFTVRKINHWNNLPWDMVESPSLEFFKMLLDKVLNNVIWAPFPMKVWTS